MLISVSCETVFEVIAKAVCFPSTKSSWHCHGQGCCSKAAASGLHNICWPGLDIHSGNVFVLEAHTATPCFVIGDFAICSYEKPGPQPDYFLKKSHYPMYPFSKTSSYIGNDTHYLYGWQGTLKEHQFSGIPRI